MAIPFGGRIAYWRADKASEYTKEEFRQPDLETGIIQEFAATNPTEQIGVSECVGSTRCAMVWCMFVGSGFPSCMWGQLFMPATYLTNRCPHKAVNMETPFKMVHDEEADRSHLFVIGTKTFVHIKDSRMLDAVAWGGKVCDHSEESKS